MQNKRIGQILEQGQCKHSCYYMIIQDVGSSTILTVTNHYGTPIEEKSFSNWFNANDYIRKHYR